MQNKNGHLLLEISNNNERAFKELYHQYYDRLISFARMYVGSLESAEDVVSDVFFNLWIQRQKISKISYFETYIYAAVKNGCYNILKSSYYQRISLKDHLNLEAYIEAETPATAAITSQLREAIEKAVNQLPDRCRLVFKMVKEDGLKYNEIGKILQISPRTVETQMAIAIEKIEKELAPFLDKD